MTSPRATAYALRAGLAKSAREGAPRAPLPVGTWVRTASGTWAVWARGALFYVSGANP